MLGSVCYTCRQIRTRDTERFCLLLLQGRCFLIGHLPGKDEKGLYLTIRRCDHKHNAAHCCCGLSESAQVCTNVCFTQCVSHSSNQMACFH